MSWTEETLRNEAAKYKRKSEFKKGSGAAYEAMRTRFPGLVQQLFVDARAEAKAAVRLWCFETVAKEALKHQTRKEFSLKKPAAYIVACKNKWLDQVCGHMADGLKLKADRNRKWTPEKIRQIAATCTTRGEFCNKHMAAVRAAKKFGIYEDICASFPTLRETWTPELIAERAAQYENLAEFYVSDPRAYEAMLRHDLVSVVGAHLRRRDPSDMDTLYIWEAVGETYNGKKVYKVGMTSQRCGDRRIQAVADQAGMEARIVLMRWLGRWYVPALEQYLLTFGEDPKLDIKDGRTEFRALTDEELQVIIKIIESHPIL